MQLRSNPQARLAWPRKLVLAIEAGMSLKAAVGRLQRLAGYGGTVVAPLARRERR